MSEKLVITRKRKKYKFAKFNEFENCFQLDEWIDSCHPGPQHLCFARCGAQLDPGSRLRCGTKNPQTTFPDKLLSSKRSDPDDIPMPDQRSGGDPVIRSVPLSDKSGKYQEKCLADFLTGTSSGLILEIGAGTGLFSVELAQRHPNNFYIAIDIKSDRLYTGAKLANELGLQNIVFIRSEISELTEIVPPDSVDEIWITFPDPFATEDQTRLTSTGNRKRLTAPKFLEMYKQVLQKNGKLNFKTDNQPLFNWSVEQLKENGWKVNKQIRDLHKSNTDDDERIMTTYEKRFVAEGLPIYYLSATMESK